MLIRCDSSSMLRAYPYGRNGGLRMPLLLLAFLIARATLTESQPDNVPPGLACGRSGMCSLGQVKPFLGDVLPSAAMTSCLKARSFRRELILIAETRLNPAYQTFRSLLQLGYEHVVLLSTDERCGRSNATWPRLGCAWSSQRLLNTNKILMDRVAFLARAGRLGYNVLMLDSDVIPFRDVYSLLWAPPLGEARLLAMRDGNGWLNCGVVYVRNARPDGPAVYVLSEVLDRLERWAANPDFFSDRGLNCFCWDQQMYSDTLLSALAGRPVSYGCWYRHDPTQRSDWDAAHIRLFGGSPVEGAALEQRHYLRNVRLEWPPELLRDAPEYPNRAAAETWLGTLRVPNSRGEWPPELGGPFYPPERGETSRLWMELLRADGPPLWPDPENPSLSAAAAAITETFAYMPMYLTETWSNGGAYGYWNAALRGPMGQPPAALAHFVHVPGGATNKLTVKMASNNWDWDVAHAAHPNRGVFFASTRAVPEPDVLAFTPELVAREWPDEPSFAAAALALIRLAMEMGRATALPAPRCNLTWLGGSANNQLPLAVHHGFHIPYSPAGKGFNDLRCLWGGYLTYGCQAVRSYYSGGLLAPEYDHLLDLLHQDSSGNSSGSSNSSAAALRSAAYLTSLGFTVGPDHMAVAHGGSSGGGSGEVVTVPPELLQPPPPAEAWDVTQLAAELMVRYGGAGSGTLFANVPPDADDATLAAAAAAARPSGGGASRPRVLALPEVPRLTEQIGLHHEVLLLELESGKDRHIMSCDWIRTGRPYRHRRRQLQGGLGPTAAAAAAAQLQQEREFSEADGEQHELWAPAL